MQFKSILKVEIKIKNVIHCNTEKFKSVIPCNTCITSRRQKMNIISVDAGKFATKAVSSKEKTTMFRTKSTQITKNMDIEAVGNSNKIKFGDKSFIVGDQGEDIDYTLEKNTLLHKMAIYLAAYRLGCTGQVNAAIGCPTNIYVSRENRREFQENIKIAPEHMSIDGEKVKINFERVLIMPESSGVVYSNEKLFRGNRVAVIDIGGRNMNFGIYDNLMPQPSSMMTTNQGSMEIEAKVKRVFEAEYKRALVEKDIEEILKQGGMKYQGNIESKSKELLKEIYNSYVEGIVSRIKKEFQLDMLDVVVTGGTSLLVKDAIAKQIPHVQVVDNTQWSNAYGFLKIAKVKFNG